MSKLAPTLRSARERSATAPTLRSARERSATAPTLRSARERSATVRLFALCLCSLATALGGACGGSGESTTGFTGTGASGGIGGSSSSTTGTGPSTCGNGKVDPGEKCDPSAPGGGLEGVTCETLGDGFNGGTLACASNCAYDTSGCTKAVNCFDGTTDCDNPACTAQCSDPCATDAVQPTPLPSTQTADTTTHPGKLDSKCSSSMGTGPNLVYQVTATTTGVLVMDVESDADLGVSVRTTCDQASTELGCNDHFVSGSFAQHLEVPCTAGDVLFVVVGGNGPTDAGDFTLAIDNRAVVCGDGFTDIGEQCDDGNTTSGDGCSATCTLEPTEGEPNDTVAQANPYASPWYAQISSTTDVDVVSVQVASTPASLTATLKDFDGHSCEYGTMEAVLTIFASDGTTILASEDAGLTDTCASAKATISQAGTYYVKVGASALSVSPTFPYILDVKTASSSCGDGMVEAGEQCDPPGPTCTASCKFIFSEKEPNNTATTATPFTTTNPWYAQIAPALDVDYFSFVVPAGEDQITVTVDDNGDGDCADFTIVAKAELISSDGMTVLATNQGDNGLYCPVITATPTGSAFTAGTYYVRVSAGMVEPMATFPYRLQIETAPIPLP